MKQQDGGAKTLNEMANEVSRECPMSTFSVLKERLKQEGKWGQQNHPPEMYRLTQPLFLRSGLRYKSSRSEHRESRTGKPVRLKPPGFSRLVSRPQIKASGQITASL